MQNINKENDRIIVMKDPSILGCTCAIFRNYYALCFHLIFEMINCFHLPEKYDHSNYEHRNIRNDVVHFIKKTTFKFYHTSERLTMEDLTQPKFPEQLNITRIQDEIFLDSLTDLSTLPPLKIPTKKSEKSSKKSLCESSQISIWI